MAHELSHVALRHGTAQQTKATPYAIGADRRRGARRDRRRSTGSRHRAGHAVRSRHGLPEIQPRVRAPGRHARHAHHGARRVRPARHGQRVPDDRAGERRGRTAVAERPPEPGQSLRLHQPGSASLHVENGRAATRARSRACRRICDRCRRRRRPRKRPRPARDATTSSGGVPDSRPSGGRIERPRPSYTTYNEGDLFRVSVPSNWQRAVGQQRRDVCARRRLRERERPERVHARRGDWHRAQRDARPADGDRRADPVAARRATHASAVRRATTARRSAAWTPSARSCRTCRM